MVSLVHIAWPYIQCYMTLGLLGWTKAAPSLCPLGEDGRGWGEGGMALTWAQAR